VFRSDDGALTGHGRREPIRPDRADRRSAAPATLYAGTLQDGVQRSTKAARAGRYATTVDHTDVLAALDPTVPPSSSASIPAASSRAPRRRPERDGTRGRERQAIAVDPATPRSSRRSLLDGVFKSQDGGASFAPANAGLTTGEIVALAIDPSTTTTLYAGTARDGVFRSLDGAATWKPFSSGLPPVRVAALASTPAPDVVYAGTRSLFPNRVARVVRDVRAV
jgi:hypothetical protein